MLFTKACDMGEPIPCFNLANHYAEGNDVKKDARKAAKLYEKACAAGFQQGCEKAKR